MDVKNLLGKLHNEGEEGVRPTPPTPRSPSVPARPVVEERLSKAPIQRSVATQNSGGTIMNEELEEGIILDLGEGLSLNIPIQKRMSLSDFIKLAEKVKALEMLSDNYDSIHR